MFHLALGVVVIGLIIHVVRTHERTRERVGELVMLYVLIGYCGVATLAVSLYSLWNGPALAGMLGFPADNPFQDFVSVALLAMSILSLLSVRYRGAYLIGPAVVWSVFFVGATFIHVGDFSAHGAMTHGTALMIFATHGLISVMLLTGLAMSGVWKAPS